MTDFVNPDVEVWEEHWDALQLFLVYSSQWRTGMNGLVGIDFNVFHHALDRKGIVGDEFDQYVSDLRVIEKAALDKIRSYN